MKTYVIKSNGKYFVNPAETPRYSDMVVYAGENLKIEAPATGYFSSAEQRKTVNDLAGEWLRGKVTPKGGGEIVIKESCEHIADGVNVSYIIATVEGSNALSNDEAVSGAGLIGEWVGNTAKNVIGDWVDKTAKKDTAKKPAPAATTAKPAANPAPAPAAGTKATPPATDSKPADTKATPPAANPAPAPVAPATKDTGVHWDNNLSVDENIRRLWDSAG